MLNVLTDETIEIEEFREKLLLLKEDAVVLVGYAPSLTPDTFVFFEDEENAKEACEIIRRLEATNRRFLKKSIFKYSRPWRTLGSEKEVNLQIPKARSQTVEIEIQRLDSGRRTYRPFEHRFSSDVRDGYVELVPKNEEFNPLTRKRINLPIQSAPRRIDLEQQTDPTFPSNAWTQYLYEIVPDGKIQIFLLLK